MTSAVRPILRLPRAQRNEDFSDLKASLEWGAGLELNAMERSDLRELCTTICGVNLERRVPLEELLEERRKRQVAERRIVELRLRLSDLVRRGAGGSSKARSVFAYQNRRAWCGALRAKRP